MRQSIRFFIKLFLPAGFILFVYFWPRFLVRTLKEDSPWTGYLYTYGLGLCVFAVTAGVIFSFRSSYPEKRKQDGFWLLVLLGVLFFGMTLHGVWIYRSVTLPFKGTGG